MARLSLREKGPRNWLRKPFMNNSSIRHVLPWVLAPCLCLISSAAICAETARKTQSGEITNTIGMKLKLIPAGEFMMGGVETAEEVIKTFPEYHRKPEEFKDEYPRHRVRITKPFFLGVHEVTVGQFRKFAEASGYKTEAERDGTGGWGYNPEIGTCEGRRPQFNWRQPRLPADRRPSGTQRHLERRRRLLPVAQPSGREDVPFADRSRVGVCLSRRHRHAHTISAMIRAGWPQQPRRRTQGAGPVFRPSRI